VTTAEYFAAVADRSGMEAAYDDERHKALHFEQATELKDHHIERLEAEFRKLRQRVETGEQHVHALAAETEQLRAANEALREELRQLREDGRAAAGNLVSVAKRGLSGRPQR
jgi:predicted RNase H-like nuclease (RuvC/YqgF family)